ncbi:MAG: alpha/beta hydrolase [Terricaulis sp.]
MSMANLLAATAHWIARVVGYFVVAVCAGIAFTALMRSGEPRYVGQLLLELAGPEILVILIVAAALAIWRVSRRRHPFSICVSIICLAAVAATTITLGGYLAVARAENIPINLAESLWPDAAFTTDPVESFTYDSYGDEAAKLYVYRPNAAQFAGPRPIIVYIHGGGWVQGRAADRRIDLSWFAQHGYLTIGVDYALSSPQRHLWDVTEPQLACALAWIGANATRFNGDATRLGMFGESAGGNLVLDLGLRPDDGVHSLQSRCGGKIPQAKAIVAIYPPPDMRTLYEHPPAQRFPAQYIGGGPQQFPERYALLSPITYLTNPAPPTLVIYGQDDSLVPPADMVRYVSQARRAGHDIKEITIARAGHGFDIIPGSINNQMVRGAMAAFFNAHGLAPTPVPAALR